MRTITFLNQKGGVGKTSSCFHLSGTLSRMGLRTLLIDNDPQASLTQGFLGPSAAAAIARESSVAALYDPDCAPPPEALIIPTGYERIWLVPGSEHLSRANMQVDQADPESLTGLRSFLNDVGAEYDVALIDCPPNLLLCSWAALAASSHLVVPLQAEDFGSQGLAPVQATVNAVQATVNPELALAGYLLTMFDKRLTVHLTYEALLRERYGAAVFAAVVPRAKDFVESVAERIPLALSKPKCAASKAVAAVAEEMFVRIGAAKTQGQRGAA